MDTLIEGDEMFTATLTTVDTSVVLDPSMATATIQDNSGELKTIIDL